MASPPPLTIVCIVDALGDALVRAHDVLPEMPVRRALRTVLGYSSAAIPSLLSGVTPAAHGHWSMYRRARGDSPLRALTLPLRAAARLPRGREWVRRRTAQWLTRTRRVRGYFSLYEVPLNLLPEFDLVERDDLFAPGGLGTIPTLFDHLSQRRLPYRVWSWRDDPRTAVTQAIDCARDPRLRALVVYRADLDATMHEHSVASGATAQLLRGIEADVRALRDAAPDRDVTLFVMSDHGMADAPHLHDIESLVAPAITRDVLPFFDSTMARFWCATDRARAAVCEALTRAAVGRIVSDDELRALGVLFADRSYGDVIFLLPEGHQIAPSFMGRHAPRAMHGYHPDDPSMDACWLTTGPGREARSILDALPAILQTLDVPA